MKLYCRKCKNEISELNLSEDQKNEVFRLIRYGSKLLAIKHLMNKHNFNHKEAKIIITHLNPEYGKCQRCNFEGLKTQNIDCPKCGAFNYNIYKPILK
ncbi:MULTISPECIES: hypothetical protein [unclassified Tenacibaculum]|uniref:hypothetical protein n=1 Tax=unclassified Tenacibaculum TaxID=2635139 RepID=UPI001F2D4B53|nr:MULTISPECIES: hypothetical protein [unclassified Tenacibaculum]MCF2875707.1 hypothetical protein [Tenacibaculum sp. Cn5-1]MCF2935783.1 hypothetical protein [Tenacibaculum sp. Cn5-34]MCG7512343.1 hypothetical protein [Tenacibaculum sp. Cn5-46]